MKSLSESILDLNNIQEYDVDLDLLSDELNMINDAKIRSFTESILIKAKPLWRSPASFIPDLHPPDEYFPGGLILHTKRVVRCAVLLINTFECTQQEFDYLIAAALLHDCTKALSRDESDDEEVFHDAMHPYTVDNFVSWCRKEDHMDADDSLPNAVDIPEEHILAILRLIRCSHGPWSPIPETIPVTSLEKILHMSDLVASALHRLVDGAEIVGERWKTS